MAKAKNGSSNGNGANLGFEATIWQAADKMRNNMDAGEYKHVVLGLVFLKYISDVFDEKYSQLANDVASGADPEDPDEYRADNIFWVPREARWAQLQGNAKQPSIGELIDMIGTVGLGDRENRSKDILGRVYDPCCGSPCESGFARSWSCEYCRLPSLT